MEMEDHHHHHHHHHHNPQRHHDHNPIHEYGITDLRRLIENGARPPPPQQIPSLSPAPPPASLETLMMMGRPISAVEIMPQLALHHHQYGAAGGGGLEADTGGGGGDGGTGRWPRQETLTLLEIRSRLDCKFKEANQKGPLWDEVSRIMSEEHGYQRSGKKCREKFENLYKYYKKTKEGKAGRQDGKHYRFFRQLEALYGETSNNNNNNQISLVQDSHDYNMANNLGFHAIPMNLSTQEGFNTNTTNNNNSLSLSNNSSEFESSSSDEGNESSENKNVKRNSNNGNRTRSSRGGWKAKIKDFIDSQMRKLMEKQEAWLEKLMRTLEQKEKERSLREEEWRRQEASRVEREHRFWAKKRAWIEARDSALMEALKNLTGKDQELALDHDHNNNDNYKVVNALLSPRPELGLNPNGPDDQDGSEIHENVNLGKGGRDHDHDDHHEWAEAEVSRLIQLRTSMESRFEQGGFPEEVLWEDIAAKMACLGYDRSGLMCREKWESINTSSNNNNNNSKKRKENSRECGYGTNFHNNNESSISLYNHGGYENCDQLNNDGTSSSPSNANVGNASSSSHHHHHHHQHHHQVVSHDSCFPFLMGEGSENLWENYGLKINKGGQN